MSVVLLCSDNIAHTLYAKMSETSNMDSAHGRVSIHWRMYKAATCMHVYVLDLPTKILKYCCSSTQETQVPYSTSAICLALMYTYSSCVLVVVHVKIRYTFHFGGKAIHIRCKLTKFTIDN
jgi:hypothetical protein